jgi:hypothetical protein
VHVPRGTIKEIRLVDTADVPCGTFALIKQYLNKFPLVTANKRIILKNYKIF